MRRSVLVLVAIAALVPVTVGCSGSNDTAQNVQRSGPTTAPSTAPTTTRPSSTPTTPTQNSTPTGGSKRLDGAGYSFDVPRGWVDITASLKADHPSLDVAVGESHPKGFRTNFNVVQATPTGATIRADASALHREAASELRSITHKPVRSLSDSRIDGEPMIGQTSSFVSSGIPVTFIQYFTIHNGRSYPLTLTFATANKAKAKSVLNALVSSWQWK
jgi:hypothetical protein